MDPTRQNRLTLWAATPASEASLIEGEGRVEGLALGKYVMTVKYDGETREVPFEVMPDMEREIEVKLGS